MAYRCVHCSETYEDDAPELINGCVCGRKFFFYIKPEKLAKLRESDDLSNLTSKEKKQMEHDVREIAGVEDEEQPVFLDFESVTVVKPGKYVIDIQKLFSKDKPRVYKLEDGKYIIDLTIKSGDKKK